MVSALWFIGALVAMEGVAYVTHRFLMHGPLWCLHASHHQPRESAFEKNDLFGLFFSVLSIVLIYLGTNGYPSLLWVGLGMTAYGAVYFGFHDVLVHRRLRIPFRVRGRYLKRIVQAHLMHHRTTTREGAVSYGFLYAPPLERLKSRGSAWSRAPLEGSR